MRPLKTSGRLHSSGEFFAVRHHPFRLCAGIVRRVSRAALRAFVTCLIFTACMLLALSHLGVPLPDLSELLEQFESVSQLSKILS